MTSSVVTCGNFPLESSFQRVPRCVYTSTCLYGYRGWDSKAANTQHRRFTWGLRSMEFLQERGELLPPEDSLDIARKVKEMYCYTSSDIVKEFKKHDKKPDKYIKQWSSIKPKTGVPYTIDIGYERFLGPEIFFNPEI